MTPTLYLTRNGLLEPLGQSQVLAYLRGLSRDHAVTLITCEKDEDPADAGRISVARAQCQAPGITWLLQRFRYRPRFVVPALSMLRMTWLARREVRQRGIRLIYARSYIPTAVAMTVSRLTRTPFIVPVGDEAALAAGMAEALLQPVRPGALRERAADFLPGKIAAEYLGVMRLVP